MSLEDAQAELDAARAARIAAQPPIGERMEELDLREYRR